MEEEPLLWLLNTVESIASDGKDLKKKQQKNRREKKTKKRWWRRSLCFASDWLLATTQRMQSGVRPQNLSLLHIFYSEENIPFPCIMLESLIPAWCRLVRKGDAVCPGAHRLPLIQVLGPNWYYFLLPFVILIQNLLKRVMIIHGMEFKKYTKQW